MNASLKVGLYVLAVLGTLISGVLFSKAWKNVNPAETEPRPVAVDSSKSAKATAPAPASPSATSTNGNVADSVGKEAAANTNSVATGNSDPSEPAADASAASAERDAANEMSPVRVSGRGWAQLLFWGFFGLASVAGLGALIAYDFSQYAGNRATDSLFDDEGEGIPDSLDDLVGKAYGAGDFLEAVRLLRAHLAEHPGSVDAQVRIAELYEKDLNNPLAAALEYEEILKRPLPLEKRGWTSIHLVNLYNRLEKPDQAVAWLQRVVAECPGTPAAAKAKDRLLAAGLEVPEAPAEPTPEEPSSPPTGLPPGFRPRGK